ncbi:MAG: hypothetical protein WC004_00725 [Candidatus Absconditabacterales bacterium]
MPKTKQNKKAETLIANQFSFAEQIVLKGVNTNNLKDIDVTFPKNKIVTITGVSGSGKSSLAFDTIYKEGQFRYIESLSSYLRQFFNLGERPDIEYSSGLSPAIAIEQNKRVANIRSTVGTLTEIDDYLRLMFAKLGQPYCYSCGDPIKAQSVESIMGAIVKQFNDNKVYIISELGKYADGPSFLKFVKKNRTKMDKGDGFTRYLVLFDNDDKTQLVEYFYLESPNIPEKHLPFYVYGIYDRITLNAENMDRLKEDIVKMLNEHNKFGLYYTSNSDTIDDSLSLDIGKDVQDSKQTIQWFTDKIFCPKCNITYPEFTTQYFSSNRSEGACSMCHGLGEMLDVQLNQIIDPSQPFLKAVIPRQNNTLGQQILTKFASKYEIDHNKVRHTLPEWFTDTIIKGDKELMKVGAMGKRHTFYYNGIVDMLTNQYNKGILGTEFQSLFGTKPCDLCHGDRLRQESLHVKIEI